MGVDNYFNNNGIPAEYFDCLKGILSISLG